jgi:hypothetical protein
MSGLIFAPDVPCVKQMHVIFFPGKEQVRAHAFTKQEHSIIEHHDQKD